MPLDNLSIERVVIHEVFERQDDRSIVAPRYGSSLAALDQEAMEALADRVMLAMGRSAQSVEMAITVVTADSMVATAAELLDLDDITFLARSTVVADTLASAQKHRKIPGGIVVVVQGAVGHPAKRWIGVIKAETQNGFTRVTSGAAINLQFLRDLILTPQTKLYKIGIFVENPSLQSPSDLTERFVAHIYDSGMSATNRDGAAVYFYEGFFGCSFPPTAARLTRKFYEHTKKFIGELNVDNETKAGLNTALVTYLKVDQKQIISPSDFATSYLPTAEIKDAYLHHLRKNSFEDRAIQKDIVEVASKLRFRNVRFTSQIKLTAPADAFDELIEITEIPAPESAGRHWTVITVKDEIATQE